MKVLVCGGRDYNDTENVNLALCRIDFERGPISEIIQGAAKGADFEGMSWAIRMDREYRSFPADWFCYGRSAGPIRNQQMLEVGKPDLVVAFPGGRGTANMVKQAKAAGVEVIEISK